MRKTKARAALVLLLLGIAFGVGLYVGLNESRTALVSAQSSGTSSLSITVNPTTQPPGVDMTQFWEAWSLLQENYVPTLSSTTPSVQDRVYGAIEGLAASYGDPYTVFFPPSEAQSFNEDISGSFAGVGIEMNEDQNGNLIVSEPLPGSPAAQAGILSGDLIEAIDGTSTQGMAIDQAVSLIRGPAGTQVTLTIQRAGQSQPLQFTITRQVINVPEITTSTQPGGIFVITFSTFTANSADLFRDALRQFFETGDTKLILDLRGNPGGYLDQAVDIASYFLPVGETIVTEDFEGNQPNITSSSYGYNVFANKTLSMAILVDQNTASAAEILSAALQQHGVAKLVGTRTFGKGSVQELLDLGNGAELKVTVARWITPNGNWIELNGLQPDIPAASTTPADVQASIDPTMQAAVSWLSTQ